MIAVVALTMLSSSHLPSSPPLALNSLFLNSPPSFRFHCSPFHRVFYLHRNFDPPCSITRVAKFGSNCFWEEHDNMFGTEEVESESEDTVQAHEEANSGVNIVSHSMSDYSKLLVKEVEQMLEPEERDILQHNEGPDISKISTKKWSLFHSLGLSLQIRLMDELLEFGWDIDSVDKDGFTALHKAVIGRKEDAIIHLLRKGASPHVRDRGGASALHFAVQTGALQTVRLLIKYKVNVNAADNDDWTPLHISMQIRSSHVAKVLLINGADITKRNKDGNTPLDLCLCYGRDFKSYDLAKMLKLIHANRKYCG